MFAVNTALEVERERTGNSKVLVTMKVAMTCILYLLVRICCGKGYSQRRKAPRDKAALANPTIQ